MQTPEEQQQQEQEQTEPRTTDDTSKAEGRGSEPEEQAEAERERREQTPGTPEHQRKEGDAEVQDEPDEDAGPSVEPLEGDQGEYVDQNAIPANAGSFDPDRPVRTSPPTAYDQSGVPQPTDGSNEGVEPDEEQRGPQDPSRPELGV